MINTFSSSAVVFCACDIIVLFRNGIHDILKGKIIIGFIKKQRLNWLGHVERMAEDNIVQKIQRWKPMPKRPTGRPKTRWQDDVLEDIMSINISNWKKVAQNRDSLKKLVEQARNLYRL